MISDVDRKGMVDVGHPLRANTERLRAEFKIYDQFREGGLSFVGGISGGYSSCS